MSFEGWLTGDDMVNERDWQEYAETGGSMGLSWMGYLSGTADMTKKLNTIINNPEITSLEQFREQMAALCEERKKFVEYAAKNTPQ